MNTKLIIAAMAIALTAPVSAQHLRPPPDALQVYQTIEFQPGATIDFADMTQQPVGPLRAYIYVRVQGELMVIPAYHPVADGTVWRVAPQSLVPGHLDRIPGDEKSVAPPTGVGR